MDNGSVAGWDDVVRLVHQLVETGESFSTHNSVKNRITSYDPGFRFWLETDNSVGWVVEEYVRACWETFERLGRIVRADVLDPGRRAGLMIGLFRQLDGVEAETDENGETVLVLIGATPHAAAPC